MGVPIAMTVIISLLGSIAGLGWMKMRWNSAVRHFMDSSSTSKKLLAENLNVYRAYLGGLSW